MRRALCDPRCLHRCGGTWRNLDGTNGLPGPVICLFQDRQDFLWMGTWGRGVVRYDGDRLQTFGLQQGLSGDTVWGITEDGDGQIWFAATAGVSMWDGRQFHRFGVADGLPHPQTNFVWTDRRGVVWVATEAGVARLQGGRFEPLGAGQGLPIARVEHIGEDSHGRMWFVGEGGAARYDGVRFEVWTELGGEFLEHVETVCVDRRDRVYLGTERGLFVFAADGGVHRIRASDGLVHDDVRDLGEDDAGSMWVATMGGASCIDEGEVFSLSVADGLVSNQLTAVHCDGAGDLWFGSFAGVSQYSRSFTSLTCDDGLAGDDVRAIVADACGRRWFATLDGLTCLDGASLTTYDEDDGLGHRRTFSVCEDRTGTVWVGTQGGLSRYDGEGRFTTWTRAHGLVHDRVYCLFEDRQGSLWLATEQGINRRRPDGGFDAWTVADGLVDGDVNAFAEDDDGRIWIATEGGVSCFDGQTFANFDGEVLPDERCHDVLVDRHGAVWVATSGGVWRWRRGRTRVWTQADGLASDQVLRLFEDRPGFLWMSTWGGVSRFDGEVFQTLTAGDGLASSIVLAVDEDAGGRLWFGTTAGLTLFQPPPATAPPVHIRAVVADRRHETFDGGLRLTATAGLTAFEFASVGFKTRPGAVIYRFRLHGHDAAWRTTNQRRVEYEGLPPGAYRFQVSAVDRDLTYSIPASVALQVVPDTRDAKIDELERRVQERTRVLQEKNEVLAQTLSQLRQAQGQLIVQEKMAALGHLVAGIAHELNTPLGTVRSSADVSRRAQARLRAALGGEDGARPAPNLERTLRALADSNGATQSAIERLTRIVESLKTFAHLDRAVYERVDIHAGLEAVLTLIEPQLAPGIQVQRDLGAVPLIYCYPQELNQVYMNLLVNASQALEGRRRGTIVVTTRHDGEYVEIVIRDDGRGIEPERLERIFDPGLATGGTRVGMGLGLPSSYQIVRRHAGTLAIDSRPGQGTTVTVRLPTGGPRPQEMASPRLPAAGVFPRPGA